LDSLLLQIEDDGSRLKHGEIVPVGIDDGWDSTVGVDLERRRRRKVSIVGGTAGLWFGGMELTLMNQGSFWVFLLMSIAWVL